MTSLVLRLAPLAALLLAIAGNMVQCSRNGRLQDQVQVLQREAAEVKAAGEAWAGISATCGARLLACVGDSTTAAASAERAAAERDAAVTERDAAMRAARARREKLYVDDADCAAWAAAPVCAGVSGELRDNWPSNRAAGAGRPHR